MATPARMSLEERLQHGTFRQPADSAIKVWRYMDLPKFIWLLTQQKLALPRLDTLADPHEGALTGKTVAWIERYIQEHQLKTGWQELSKHFRDTLHQAFVSCWHANEHESEAMWRLYCGMHGGVAVQTSYAQLAESLRNHSEAYIGCVNYIDYDSDAIHEANLFAPVMHKRVAFSHEREVRVVTAPLHLRSLAKEEAPRVTTLDWSPESHTQKIYVSPYAPEYFYESVLSAIRAFCPALEPRLVWSYMKAAPIF